MAGALVSSIITARLLGPEGRGQFFFWSTIAGFILQIGNLGLHSSNAYILARDINLFGALASNALFVALSIGILSLVGLIAIEISQGTLSQSWSYIWPTTILASSGLYFLFGTNLLVARSCFVDFNVLELSNRYLSVVLVAVLALHFETASAALAGTATASVIICVPLYLRIRRFGGAYFRPKLALLRRGFGYALRAYLCALLAFLVLRAGTFILERYANPIELGTWSIAVQILDIINIMPGAVGIVLLPGILRSATPYRMMIRSLFFVGAGLLVLAVGTVAFGHLGITLLYGQDFSASYRVLLWGLPGSVAIGFLTITSQYLATAGIPRRLILIWGIGLAVEIVLALTLVPLYGAEGCMIAFSLAHIFVFAVVWWLVQIQRRREHEFRSTDSQSYSVHS